MGDYADAMIDRMGFGGISRGKTVPYEPQILNCPVCSRPFKGAKARRQHLFDAHGLRFKKHAKVSGELEQHPAAEKVKP